MRYDERVMSGLEVHNERKLCIFSNQREFEDVINSMPDAVFIVTESGAITFANIRAEALLGYTQDAMATMTVEDLVPSRLRDVHTRERDAWFKTPHVRQMGSHPDLVAVASDGREIPVEIMLSPIQLGNKVCSIASMRDISERQEYELKLESTLRRLDAVAKITTDVIFDFDADSETFEWYGDVDKALGYRRGEFPRTMEGWAAHIHPDDHDDVMAKVEELLQTGADAALSYRIRTKDGSYRDWKVLGRAITIRDGRPVRWIGACDDITDRKHAEEEQRHSEALSAAVLLSLDSHVAVLDRDGAIVSVNSSWKQFARENGDPDLSHTDVGINYLDVCRRAVAAGDRSAAKALEGLEEVLSGCSMSFTHDYACPSKGRDLWFTMRVVPLRREEGGLVILHQDITSLREAEMVAQRHRDTLAHVMRVATIGEISSSLAHELNQPLTAILNNAEAALRMLSAGTCSEVELGEILRDVVADDKRAGEIVKRVRALLRKDTAQHELISVNAVIHNAAQLLANDATAHRVKHDLHLDHEPPCILGDTIQLQQVIINLLLNAYDALDTQPADKRRIRITTSRQQGSVRIEVRDWGPGLPQETDLIFQPFHTTKPKGLGMGLAISRTIVESHGGTMEAVSDEGEGATFVIELPEAGTSTEPGA